MKDTAIWDEYFVTLDESRRLIVSSILEEAMRFLPEAVPALPYGVPGLTHNKKPLIAVVAHKEHYGVYPFSPEVIRKLEPLLGDLETAKGTIRFPYDKKPTKKLIKVLLKLRSEEIG